MSPNGAPAGHWVAEQVQDPETGELVRRERYVIEDSARSDCISYSAPPSVRMTRMVWSDGPSRSFRYY